jgi:hypothetical protein
MLCFLLLIAASPGLLRNVRLAGRGDIGYLPYFLPVQVDVARVATDPTIAR